MVWQRAGSVTVQTNSNTVTGVGVDFAASSRNGDSFIGPDGFTYEVGNVASATVISIVPAYKGPSVSGGAYAIMPVQGYDKMLSDAFNNLNNQFGPKLAALGTTGNYDILPVSKGGTGRTTIGTSITADIATSLSDTTPGRLLPVGYGGLGAKDNMPYLGDVNPDDYRAGGEYLGNFLILGTRKVGVLIVHPGSNATFAGQEFLALDEDSKYFRTQSLSSWRAWKKLPGAGANTDITSLSGLTTAISVSQGGTGGKTQADARAGLGLGSAATATVGSAVGNVMAVGAGGLLGVAIGIPQGTALSLVQKTQFSTTSSNADVPAAAPYSTLITIKYPEGFRQSELAANILDGSLYSRVTLANGATTPWRKIYDDTNTTRAADGTLKAI
nr:pyocin knob domain-containing protein [Pseudomonas tolaasii]